MITKNLLQHFGSIESIAKASVKDLEKVRGIGKRKAIQIYEIFH
ncbi:MAG TPA: hypothetical protein ENG74_02355 [Thermoplasmatales archaeon]|nr:hypothetical protein [Thermoplasmatales archaeon]